MIIAKSEPFTRDEIEKLNSKEVFCRIMDDKIGNLYRAAFYIAKGAEEVGLNFLKKSGKKFEGLKLATRKQRLFWAEKILDEYTKMKYEI